MALSDVWLFGYGSLIWRPDFAHVERIPAHIHDWSRRFWQGSTDHRGTPDRPGRVVTLIPDPGARCGGMAYRIEGAVWEPIGAALDHREKGGYDRHELPIALEDGRQVSGLVYLAGPDNPNYAGPAPLDEIAAQILDSSGPSGPNLEYLLRLDEALKQTATRDVHVSELATRVRRRRGD